MRMSRSITYDTKTGNIKRIDLKIYPEELTLKSSSSGVQLTDDIRTALIKDSKRAIKEEKQRLKILKGRKQ